MRPSRTEKIRADLQGARDAVATIERLTNPVRDAIGIITTENDAATIAAAAKTIEAFGCYVRRTKIGG